MAERFFRGMAPLALAACVAMAAMEAVAAGPVDPTAVKSEDGKYFDKNGDPTYNVEPDGTVDWYTYSGFMRYSAECLRCHGPDGMGSSYGPTLSDSLKRLSYSDVYGTVAAGRQNVTSSQTLVMPSLGADRNVMCYIDSIYVYLRARSTGAVGRGRPAKHAPKPDSFAKAENECMG